MNKISFPFHFYFFLVHPKKEVFILKGLKQVIVRMDQTTLSIVILIAMMSVLEVLIVKVKNRSHNPLMNQPQVKIAMMV